MVSLCMCPQTGGFACLTFRPKAGVFMVVVTLITLNPRQYSSSTWSRSSRHIHVLLKPYIWLKRSRIVLGSHTIAGLCLSSVETSLHIHTWAYRSVIASTLIYQYHLRPQLANLHVCHNLCTWITWRHDQSSVRHALFFDNSTSYAPSPLYSPDYIIVHVQQDFPRKNTVSRRLVIKS